MCTMRLLKELRVFSTWGRWELCLGRLLNQKVLAYTSSPSTADMAAATSARPSSRVCGVSGSVW